MDYVELREFSGKGRKKRLDWKTLSLSCLRSGSTSTSKRKHGSGILRSADWLTSDAIGLKLVLDVLNIGWDAHFDTNSSN